MSDVAGSGLSADRIAERAKQKLKDAEEVVDHARRRLQEAEEQLARAKGIFIEADLQRDCSWNNMYRRLIQYKKEHDGDVLVLTSKDSSPEIKKLAKWVQNQRVHYKCFVTGDKKHIKEHRIDALNRVGFVWNVIEHSWNSNFNALVIHYEKYGHFEVTKSDSVKLRNFVANLRKAFRRKMDGLFQKELTDERMKRLNAIGFTFNGEVEMNNARPQKDEEDVQFDHLYNLLVDFKETYGHVQVSKMMKIWHHGDEEPTRKEYKRLPFFIARVRNEHEYFLEGKPCVLDSERVQKLTDLGIKWKRPASESRKGSGAKRQKREKAAQEDCDNRNGENVEDDEEILTARDRCIGSTAANNYNMME